MWCRRKSMVIWVGLGPVGLSKILTKTARAGENFRKMALGTSKWGKKPSLMQFPDIFGRIWRPRPGGILTFFSKSVKQPAAELSKPPTMYSHAPANLWGLLPAARETAQIVLDALGPKTALKDDAQVYSVAAQWLCKLWDKYLILKPMVTVDKALNGGIRKITRQHLAQILPSC
ncbi:hypothetical protein B0H19DRAFT_1083493 [Mycena capillaripes]|nr:hypothetical protein B0H19DRAFT_1083493 [Mycena capillaripes]